MSDLVFSTHHTAAQFGRATPVAHDTQVPPTRAVVGTIRMDPWLNGPRHSANGGFAAGTIARHVDADTVTVALRRPVPLRRPLDVVDAGHGAVDVVRRRRFVPLSRADRVVAQAHPGHLVAGADPVAPSFDAALIARDAHPLGGVRHALSDCVVCGPARADGMHVTPGFVPGRPEMLAAPWIVAADVASSGIALFAAVWAAMDCTSYPAAALRDRVLCLLGTMTAEVERRPRVGERLVVYSWTREHHGRRHETSVAIVDAAGERIARADATWIALRHQRLHSLRMRPTRR